MRSFEELKKTTLTLIIVSHNHFCLKLTLHQLFFNLLLVWAWNATLLALSFG